MRCHKCNKKINFSSFECKCKYNFCIDCLSSFNHNCSFDYKNNKKKILSEENQKIIANKVDII